MIRELVVGYDLLSTEYELLSNLCPLIDSNLIRCQFMMYDSTDIRVTGYGNMYGKYKHSNTLIAGD